MENRHYPCPFPRPIAINEVKVENSGLVALVEGAIDSLEGDGNYSLPGPFDDNRKQDQNVISPLEDDDDNGNPVLDDNRDDEQIEKSEKNENEKGEKEKKKKKPKKPKKTGAKKSGNKGDSKDESKTEKMKKKKVEKKSKEKKVEKEKKTQKTGTGKKLPTQKRNQIHECGQCERSFTETWNRDRHVRQQHGYELNGKLVVDRWVCPVRSCKQPPMLSFFNLTTHVARYHPKNKKFQPKKVQFEI